MILRIVLSIEQPHAEIAKIGIAPCAIAQHRQIKPMQGVDYLSIYVGYTIDDDLCRAIPKIFDRSQLLHLSP